MTLNYGPINQAERELCDAEMRLKVMEDTVRSQGVGFVYERCATEIARVNAAAAKLSAEAARMTTGGRRA